MNPLRPFLMVLLALACLIGAPRAQGPQPYRILLTNDDGVRAPGILAVAQALGPIGEVTVVAPNENQSAKSHALSITDPVYVDAVELPGGLKATSLTATPASCVKVALASLLASRPDLVVSGINRGYNLGMVAYVSGTVGAAREAALQGIPAIASSLALGGHPNYGPAAEMTARLARLVRERGLPPGTFLNLNVPAGPLEAIKGLRLATQSTLGGVERFEERKTPGGRRYFWNIYDEPTADREGTDVWAASQGYAAVTPLRIGEFDAKTFEGWKELRK